MQRILVLNWRGPDHPQAGGAEVYLLEMARRWSAGGCSVTLVCADRQERPFACETRLYDGLTIRSMGNRFTIYLLAALFLLFRSRRYDRILDISNGIPFFAPLFTRSPVTLLIHHVHQLQWTMEFPRPVAQLGWFLESRVIPRLYRRHPVITISRNSAAELQTMGFDRQQLWIVHPGAEHHFIELNSRADGHRILYIGRLKDYKRVRLLVQAVDLLRHEFSDVHLDIVGRGPESHTLEEIILQMDLNGHVTMHGYLDEWAKDSLYEQATVFATASRVEGWGLSVVEASSHGVPVVAYRAPGLNESVRHGETGFLVASEAPVEVFANAIGQIMRDPALQERLARGGQRWAGQFDWETSAEKALSVMEHGQERLLKRRGEPNFTAPGSAAALLMRINRLPSRLVVFGSFAGTSLINYAFGLLMAALLLPGDFGLLAFAQTVLLLAGLVLNSGYAWSLTAALPRAAHLERGRLVRGMLVSNLLLALLLSALLLLLYAAGPLQGGLERWSITLIIAASLPFLSVIAIGRGATRGAEAFGSMGAIQVSEVAIKLAGGLILVALGFGPEGAVAGFLVGAILAAALSLFLISQDLRISLIGSVARISLLRVSSMFAAVLGMALLLNLDILAVKLLAGEDRALAGHYQASIILANVPYFMTTALLAVLFPQLAVLGSLKRTGPRLAETMRLILLYLIPIELALAFAPNLFLNLFFPDSYMAGAPFLRILAFGNIALILAATLANAFEATGLARIPAAVFLSIVSAEIVGLWFLVPVGQGTAAAGLFAAGGSLSLIALGVLYLNKMTDLEPLAVMAWLGRYLVSLALSAALAFTVLALTERPLIALAASLVLYGLMLVTFDLLPLGSLKRRFWIR